MKFSGILFMALSWTAIISLMIYTYYHLLRNPKMGKKNKRG